MSPVEKAVAPILYLIRYQKKKIALALVAALIFSILLFPYDDLSDKITELISKNTQNQVFLQFDDLGVGLLPPSLKMSNVVVDAQFLPTSVKAATLRLAPSIAGFLAFSPGFSASIEDVLSGQVALTYRAEKKVSEETRMQTVDLDLSQVDLQQLTKFLNLPITPSGAVRVELDSDFDPNFVEQPDAAMQVQILKFSLPASTVPTMLGPLALPSTDLSKIVIRGRLRGGDFEIEEAQIGGPGETINGRIKGRIGMRLVRQGNQVVPILGAYDFKVDLNLDRNAEKNFGLFLSFIDKFKTVTGTGTRYSLRLTAPNAQVPPTPGPMGTF